jgi:hypothetical protein
LPQLAFVQIHRETESFLDRRQIIPRPVFSDLVFQFLKQLLDAIGRRSQRWRFGGAGNFGGH